MTCFFVETIFPSFFCCLIYIAKMKLNIQFQSRQRQERTLFQGQIVQKHTNHIQWQLRHRESE